MASISKLDPLDFSKERDLYESKEETQKLWFPKCPHKHTKIVNGVLKCQCGAGWSADTATLINLQQTLNRT